MGGGGLTPGMPLTASPEILAESFHPLIVIQRAAVFDGHCFNHWNGGGVFHLRMPESMHRNDFSSIKRPPLIQW